MNSEAKPVSTLLIVEQIKALEALLPAEPIKDEELHTHSLRVHAAYVMGSVLNAAAANLTLEQINERMTALNSPQGVTDAAKAAFAWMVGVSKTTPVDYLKFFDETKGDNMAQRRFFSFEALQSEVIHWAEARKIIPNSTPTAQFMKMVSEMGELADAIQKGRRAETKDGVGDVLVCLINTCALLDIDPVDCLELAWNQIKDRKGTMLPSGVFVKEGDVGS